MHQVELLVFNRQLNEPGQGSEPAADGCVFRSSVLFQIPEFVIACDRLAVIFNQQCDGAFKMLAVTGDVAEAEYAVDALLPESFQRLHYRFGRGVDIADETNPGRQFSSSLGLGVY